MTGHEARSRLRIYLIDVIDLIEQETIASSFVSGPRGGLWDRPETRRFKKRRIGA
jgi:hypothetical protein